ncbi:hypothetical protein [Streptomyces sp. NPDC001410]|uniref:hypothetical protein n=1 Tax=Streptomyces sp. NPDC001410 TaxID=3364574 RepID=UPI0036CB8F0B
MLVREAALDVDGPQQRRVRSPLSPPQGCGLTGRPVSIRRGRCRSGSGAPVLVGRGALDVRAGRRTSGAGTGRG